MQFSLDDDDDEDDEDDKDDDDDDDDFEDEDGDEDNQKSQLTLAISRLFRKLAEIKNLAKTGHPKMAKTFGQLAKKTTLFGSEIKKKTQQNLLVSHLFFRWFCIF